MGTWALIESGNVVNTIAWDGPENSPIEFDDGITPVEIKDGESVSIGYSYDKEGFHAPEPSEEDVKAQNQLLITNNIGVKESLMSIASSKIGVLQDAVDLEIATDIETAELPLWKKFRVLVSRVEANTSDEIDWPESPS